VAYLPIKENPDVKGTGHFFGAMRIDAFRPAAEFKEMMDKWIMTFRNSKPAEGHDKVFVPGDPERENTAIRMKEGIPIMPLLIEKANEIAVELGISKLNS
jgi:LDH2 family malate/lactate/ureidoglycolate dehydrogenase